MTVDELAIALDLTRSAVRAHLATLRHDGLIEEAGSRRGTSKPARLYGVTRSAELLFSRAYVPILSQLMHVLAQRLPPADFESIMRDVGRGALEGRSAPQGPLRSRVAAGSALLNDLGGLSELEEEDGQFVIRGYACPLSAATASHPETCSAIESLLTEYIGTPVTKCCDPSGAIQCCFTVASTEAGSAQPSALDAGET
jgi:predicted ArsR family transcriptional regulator